MGSKAQTIGGQGELAYIAEQLRPLALPIADLHPDPANARTHDDRNIAAIVASLSRFGQRLPIVVQKQGMIVRAGNGRLAAAKSLGWSHLACVVVDEASVDATAYAIADNRTAELAGWDDETLASLLQSLPDDARLAAGFDDGELKELLDGLTPHEVVEDDAPAPLPTPVSKTGDLWVLGGHRLLCGDSTSRADVEAVLDGEQWACMVTDPPYGVAYEGGRNPESNTPRKALAGDGTASLYAAFLPVWMPHRATKGVAYIWFAGVHGGDVYRSVAESGMEVRALLVWNKLDAHYGNFMAQYMQKHEPCLYCVADGTDWHGPTNEVTVWDIKQPTRNEHHPTEKPIECMARGIHNSTATGAVVVDAFSGSGTTIVADEQLGRRCFAIEIEPLYVDVAVRRWQKLTGKEAVHEATGKTWRETAQERGVDIEQ